MLLATALLVGSSVLFLQGSCDAKENKTWEDRKPVTGAELKDGSYQIEVESSSSMFRVVDAQLKVEQGVMRAVLTLSGKGYLWLYMGTGKEAEKAPEEEYIPFRENAEGMYTYEIPVAALDKELDCAAYSKRKEKWYDRTLVFLSDSLPPELEDGTYQVEVALSGGTGKAKIASPAKLLVENGQPVAVIEWSSPNYDYMKLEDQLYYPVNTEGNAVFHLPVTVWDKEIPVIADTTAMSEPHEIAYTLNFAADSVKEDGMAVKLAVVAIGVVAALAVASGVVYKTRKKSRV